MRITRARVETADSSSIVVGSDACFPSHGDEKVERGESHRDQPMMEKGQCRVDGEHR